MSLWDVLSMGQVATDEAGPSAPKGSLIPMYQCYLTT